MKALKLTLQVDDGAIAIGLLNEAKDKWIGSRTYHQGPFEDTLIFDPQGSRAVTIVVTTAGAAVRSKVTLASVGFDVVLADDRVPNVSYARRSLNQGPDSRADRVQPIVDALREMQEGGLAAQITPDLLRRGRDSRVL